MCLSGAATGCPERADSYTHDVPALAAGAVAALILTAVAFVGRVVTVAALSARHPRTAAFVNRYWMWLPAVVIGIAIAVLLWPIGPVLVAAAIGLALATPDLFRSPPHR
jgi:hypothetical protein